MVQSVELPGCLRDMCPPSCLPLLNCFLQILHWCSMFSCFSFYRICRSLFSRRVRTCRKICLVLASTLGLTPVSRFPKLLLRMKEMVSSLNSMGRFLLVFLSQCEGVFSGWLLRYTNVIFLNQSSLRLSFSSSQFSEAKLVSSWQMGSSEQVMMYFSMILDLVMSLLISFMCWLTIDSISFWCLLGMCSLLESRPYRGLQMLQRGDSERFRPKSQSLQLRLRTQLMLSGYGRFSWSISWGKSGCFSSWVGLQAFAKLRRMLEDSQSSLSCGISSLMVQWSSKGLRLQPISLD